MPKFITPANLRGGALLTALFAILLLAAAPDTAEASRFLEGAALVLMLVAATMAAGAIGLSVRSSRAPAYAPDLTHHDPETGVRSSFPIPPTRGDIPRFSIPAPPELTPPTLTLPPLPQPPLLVNVDAAGPEGDRAAVAVRQGGELTDVVDLPPGWTAIAPYPGKVDLHDESGLIKATLRQSDGRFVDWAGNPVSNWLGEIAAKAARESADPAATTHANPPDFTQEARNSAIPADSMPTGAAVRSTAYLDLLRNAPPRAARARAVLDERQHMEAAYIADRSDRLLCDAPALTDLQREVLQGAATGAEGAARKLVDAALTRLADFRPALLAGPDAEHTISLQRAIAVAADVKAEAGSCLTIAGRALDMLIDENQKLRKVAVQQIGMAVAAQRELNAESVDVEGAIPDDAPTVRITTTDHASGDYVPPQRRQLQALGREFVLAQLLELGWLQELPGGYVWDMQLPTGNG